MSDSPTDDKYIRTFAKDMARQQGKPAPESTTQSGPPVALETDRTAVLERLRARAAQDPVTEGQLLPDTLPTPVAAPLERDAPIEEMVPMPPKKEEAWKAGDLPTYAPQAPIANVYREPLPETTALPNIEPVIQAPVVLEVAVPIASVEEGSSPLHTYSSDFSDRIDSNRSSTFSVLAAQSDAMTGPVSTTQKKFDSKKPLYMAIGGVLLLILAGAGSYGAYRYVAQKSTVMLIETVSSLVFADERVELTGEGASLQNAMVASLTQPLGANKVRVFYMTSSSSTPARGTFTSILPGGVLLGSLQLRAPDILLRNVGPESTVGAVHAGNETRVFFILRVLSYERTFAGMLGWEQSIKEELALFYPEYPSAALPAPTIVTTTKIVKGKRVVATTTVEATAPEYVPPHFIDEVASNHNVRALKDMAGRTILLYGYKDKDTLIIARDEAAFAELINRLSATKQQ